MTIQVFRYSGVQVFRKIPFRVPSSEFRVRAVFGCSGVRVLGIGLLCLYPLSLAAQSEQTDAPVVRQSAQTEKISASPEREEITVTGEGVAAFNGDVAAAQEEAVWDAKRNAVEQAVGVFVKSKTIGRDSLLEEDEVQGRTQGFVRKWEIVEGSRRIENVPGAAKGRLLHIQVQATVALLPLIRRLSDMEDVYKDLERPRIRVFVSAKPNAAEAARNLETTLVAAMRQQGFEVASDGASEIELRAALTLVPTIRIGDKNAPYGVGDAVAACRAQVTMQAISTTSEESLFLIRQEASGRSFQSNEDAAAEAGREAGNALLAAQEQQFVPHLLARWARERQEGHVVVIHAQGLNPHQRSLLHQFLADMRGFRRFTEDTQNNPDKKGKTSFRILTRRDTRSIRRDLAALPLDGDALAVRDEPGPQIVCTLRGLGKQASATLSLH